MEEYSVAFLAKNRHLDEKKRRWIQDHVRKRECVLFVDAQETIQSRTHLFGPIPVQSIKEADEDDSAKLSALCRCGRLLKDHVELRKINHRSRDYRLFSSEMPTDVFVELVHSEASKTQPLSFSPKQMIRLAADTELDVLRQLIGPIWHVPKSSFHVSIHGSTEGNQLQRTLSSHLRELLPVLSNPGSVVLTMSQTDDGLYDDVMSSCNVTWSRVPFAEVIPVIFLAWSGLTKEEKLVLRQLTDSRAAEEFSKVRHEVRALRNVEQKAYFLLVDYGVDSDPSSVLASLEATDACIRGKTGPADRECRLENPASSPHTGTTSTEHMNSEESGTGIHHQLPRSTAPFASVEEEQEEEDADKSKFHALSASVHHDEIYENVPLARVRQPKREESGTPSSDPSSLYQQASSFPNKWKQGRSWMSDEKESEYSSEDAASLVSEERGRRGTEEDFKFFSYNFPHPLRGRVETLLTVHTHDPDGQGSVVILYGVTSFPDLAAAHGAIRSGMPVIFDQNGRGATALLLAVMKDADHEDDQRTSDLVSDNRRQAAISDTELQKVINKHQAHLKDFHRYEGQVFRVVRDILDSRHLVTVFDFNPSAFKFTLISLVTATVDAFIRARPGEEAVSFIKKNTMRLAGEDMTHPVKKAQREFQTAVVRSALKENRPDLLDVVMVQGFVSEFEVFKDLLPHCLKEEEARKLLSDDNIPYTQIKDLQCFEARQYFVQRICQLRKVADSTYDDQSQQMTPVLLTHHLFLYAVLNGKTELAKHFWKQVVFQDHVVHALVASYLSTFLADRISGDRQVQVFSQQAEEFAALAKGTLNDCYHHDSKKAAALVTQRAEAFGLSPIEAAVSFEMRSFVAHPASSLFLESVWKGQEMPQSREPKTNTVGCQRKCSSLLNVFTSPRSVCFTSTVFYVLFLGLYGHNIIFQPATGQLSPLDITLMVWVGTFFLEEILQLLRPKAFLVTSGSIHSSFRSKLTNYMRDVWNILDIISILFFILGYTLRVALPTSDAGHVILSLVYVLFFLKLLRVLTVSRSIGPMLPMIWNMLGDLIPFLAILFIFVLAYALTSEALLHPGTSWHWLYLLYLPSVAFWPIFGEYGLDSTKEGECQENNTLWYTEAGADVLCPSSVGRHMVPVLLGLYILITNVLMLNLLIAYFNHSFEKVHSESHEWWAWLRCGLIGEYCSRPVLPPPLVLLYRLLQLLWWMLGALRTCGQRCLHACTCICNRRKMKRAEAVVTAPLRSLECPDEDLYGEVPEVNIMRSAGHRRAISREHMQYVFAEHVEVLEQLDLEDFRFSGLGRGKDQKNALFHNTAAEPGSSNESAQTNMTELQQWEAVRASCHLLSQQHQASQVNNPTAAEKRPSAKKQQSLQADLEDVLLRLEKKVEDNKEHLRALTERLMGGEVAPPDSREGDVEGTSVSSQGLT